MLRTKSRTTVSALDLLEDPHRGQVGMLLQQRNDPNHRN
jgi:hypothetical protein